MHTMLFMALIAPALVVLVPLLIKWGPLLLSTIILPGVRALITHKVKNEKVKAVLLRIDDALGVAVLAVTQTYVDGLDRDHDGSISTAESMEAKRRAIEEAHKQMGPDTWKVWVDLFFAGNESKAEDAFTARLEAKVAEFKNLKPGPNPLRVPGLDRESSR